METELAPVRARAARLQEKLAQLRTRQQQLEQVQAVHDRRFAWLQFFADLQDRLVKVEDVWLDSLRPVAAGAGAPLRLVVSGRMLDRANPLAKVSQDTVTRVRVLFAELAKSPGVASVEGEHFDTSQPGVLRFDLVLVVDPAHPL
jgi:type IV pilus assembly protein PilM